MDVKGFGSCFADECVLPKFTIDTLCIGFLGGSFIKNFNTFLRMANYIYIYMPDPGSLSF